MEPAPCVLYSTVMKLVFEIEATSAEADDASIEVWDYLTKVEGVTVLNYWIENE
jgi:hypothetical protein